MKKGQALGDFCSLPTSLTSVDSLNKPKVQSFLVPHKNDKYLKNPQRDYTKSILDNIFGSEPVKKVVPQMRGRSKRLNYYKNLKEEEIAARRSRMGSVEKNSPQTSNLVNSPGSSSPGLSPRDSPRTHKPSIFAASRKTRFCQEFLDSIISVAEKDARKTSQDNMNQALEQKEAINLETPENNGTIKNDNIRNNDLTEKLAGSEISTKSMK